MQEECPLRVKCCLAPINQEHYEYCSANADVAKVDESFKKDKERWTQGYVENNSQNLRKRALREHFKLNGHSIDSFDPPGFQSWG